MSTLPFSNLSYAQGFQTVIPSDFAAVHSLQERVEALLKELEYGPRDRFSVLLALEESLVNAIKHGHHNHLEESIRVSVLVNAEAIRLEIEDHGQGFQPDAIPSPLKDENLTNPNGRGLMLLKSFMDLVSYNEVGNRLQMEKLRTELDPEEELAATATLGE